MNKQNKFIIPALLLVAIFFGEMLLFLPVQNASTVHVTLAPELQGLKCVTETDTVTGPVDGKRFDIIPDFPITVLGIRVSVNDNNDFLGIDANLSLSDHFSQSSALADDNAAERISDTPREILSLLDTGTMLTIQEGLGIQWIWDADNGADLENGDVITTEICALVADPSNFDASDIIALTS